MSSELTHNVLFSSPQQDPGMRLGSKHPLLYHKLAPQENTRAESIYHKCEPEENNSDFWGRQAVFLFSE